LTAWLRDCVNTFLAMSHRERASLRN
jgi:hypothetical protein